MINALRRKLFLLFSCAASLILAAVLSWTFLYNQNQLHRQYELQLTQKMMVLLQTLIQDGRISGPQWAERERQENLIIHIDDNGSIPLFCKRQLAAQAPLRQRLLDLLDAKAQDDFFYPSIWLQTQSSQPNIYSFTEDGVRYYGIKSRVTGHQNCRVSLLQAIPEYYHNQNRQLFTYSLIFICGTALLSALGWLAMGRMLRPIEENRKRQNRFIAAASHELRSPLAVIQTTAYALPGEPEHAARFLTRIEDECARMARLITQMLTLASGDAGGWQISLSEVDADQILAPVYERYEQAALRENRSLLLQLPQKELPRLYCDEKAVLQILSILFDNAFAYTPPGTPLALRCQVEKNKALILVEDHGPGIPAAHKPHIFERFYRSDQSRTDKQHFGLGLSIAAELAAMQYASLTVCDTPGGGATFVLSLPLAIDKKKNHSRKKRAHI